MSGWTSFGDPDKPGACVHLRVRPTRSARGEVDGKPEQVSAGGRIDGEVI